MLNRLVALLLLAHAGSAQAAPEPQKIDPLRDSVLIGQLPNLYKGGAFLGDRFNILIIGQDEPSTNAKLADGRARLTSRSDIIMVLSLDLKGRNSAIFSIYRDHHPSRLCEKRMGKDSPAIKINGVYSIDGRLSFLPCMEGQLEGMLLKAGASISSQYLDHGRFPIHALMEMTRNQTLVPLGQEAASVVLKNKRRFLGLYGFNLAKALAVVFKPGAFAEALLPAVEKISDEQVNMDQLFQDLVVRKTHPAGGYQRAFNSAFGIANVLGWAAYGIEGSDRRGYEFMGELFGETIDRHFSRSIDFKTLEQSVFLKNGDHVLRHLCFENGVSPLKIFQWGEDDHSFAIVEKGGIKVSDTQSSLNLLKILEFLPSPPSCH